MMKRTNLTAMTAARVSIGALIAGFGLIVPQTAFAQAAAAPEDDAKAGDIIVTGSRITKAGFSAPTPTTVLGAEAIEARAAVTVANVLYELPSVQPRPALNGTSQAGGNFVNLRALGPGNDPASASRTLVLVDGRRFVPTNNQGQVDLNVIPTALVERLDVVTGGASAAYGSDAVAGVVNVILKKKLKGFIGDIQDGISNEGDYHQFKASLAWGASFADDRGQFMIAGEYSKQSDTITQANRTWANQHTGLATVNGQIVRVDGLTLGGYTEGGVIIASNGARLPTTSPLYGRQFLSSTASSPFNYGALVAGNGNVQIGGDGGWISDSAVLAPPSERKTLFARGSYELASNVTAWVEGSYSHSRSDFDLFKNEIRSGAVEPYIVENRLISSYDANGVLLGTALNPLIPIDIRNIMTTNNISSITIGRIAPDLGNLHSDSRVRVVRGAFGLDGKIGDSWRWNAYYSHGRTNFTTDLSNNIIEPNLASALDVVLLNGNPTCRVNVPGLSAGTGLSLNHSAGCVVANPFGPGSLAPAKNYIVGTLSNVVKYAQDAAAVSIQGEPFSTWAGPVSVAVGGEWRHETLDQTTSPFANINNGSLLPSGSFQQANPKSFSGSVTVKEGFGELAIPLLRDMALGHSLDLNAAFRYTSYSIGGNVQTWKVGGTYSPVEGVLFRAVRSRDIRAATLTQLYGRSSNFANLRIADNSTVAFATINAGNPNLKPEVANTLSFGGSITGLSFLPGLSLSVDYYKIELDGFIGQVGNQNILDSCFGATRSGSLSTLDLVRCDTFVGNGTAGSGLAAIAAVGAHSLVNPQLNVGKISTSGVDFELGHRFPLSKIFSNSNAALSTRFLATYINNLTFAFDGSAVVDRAGDVSGSPQWRWSLTEAYKSGPFTLTAQARWTGPMDLDKTLVGALAPVERRLPPAFYLNVGAQFRVIDTPTKRLEFYVDVNNLLNREPPFSPNGTNGVTQTSVNSGIYTNQSWYDAVGRTFTVGLRFKY
jgi:iron complex outermembrane recepter protein